jgi:hypothetical protein
MEGISSTFCTDQQTKKEASRVTKLLLLLSPAGSVWPPSPGLPCTAHCACCLLGLLFHSDDRGGIFLQNINIILPDHMVSHPRRQEPSFHVVHHVLCAANQWMLSEKFVTRKIFWLPLVTSWPHSLPIHAGYLYLQHSPSWLASCPAILLASGDDVSGESPCDRRPIRGEYFSKLSLDLDRGAAGSKRPDIPFRRGELWMSERNHQLELRQKSHTTTFSIKYTQNW